MPTLGLVPQNNYKSKSSLLPWQLFVLWRVNAKIGFDYVMQATRWMHKWNIATIQRQNARQQKNNNIMSDCQQNTDTLIYTLVLFHYSQLGLLSTLLSGMPDISFLLTLKTWLNWNDCMSHMCSVGFNSTLISYKLVTTFGNQWVMFTFKQIRKWLIHGSFIVNILICLLMDVWSVKDTSTL